jgi:hypothetical protein
MDMETAAFVVGQTVIATRRFNGSHVGQIDTIRKGQAKVVHANGGHAWYEMQEMEQA